MASERPKKYKRHIPKRLDGRRNCRVPAHIHAIDRIQAEDGWLKTSDWAEKYGIDHNTAQQWVRKGFLEAKPLRQSGEKVTAYQVMDAEPDKHPSWVNKLRAEGAPGYKGRPKLQVDTPEGSTTTEKRKAILKETYLPRLLAMFEKFPDRLSFTSRELKDNLGETKEDGTYVPLNNNNLHGLWPSWGLRPTVFNDNPSQFNSEKRTTLSGIDNKIKSAYLRSDLYNFFTGNWGVKGYSNIDSRLKQNIIGAPTTEDGYYHYDKNSVYPLDSDGFFAWFNDFKPMYRDKKLGEVVPIKLRRRQVEFIKEVLRMDPDARYVYNVGFISLARGEGKSVTLKLIALFRFFNGYAEDIKIAGNSKDEATSVHYDEMRDVINDTPKLRNFPGLDVKGKHIVIYKGDKDIFNKIECVPKASGLHPNMTLGLITELHNYTPQDRKFYSNFISSRRGTPNAMVLVDSTVEDEGTIIHGEWKKYTAGKLEQTFFYHKDCDDGYDNPETTSRFLADESERMTEDEYRKSYGNKWGDAATTYFGPRAVRMMEIAGIDGNYGPSPELVAAVDTLLDLEGKLTKFTDLKVNEGSLAGIRKQIDAINSQLIFMDDLYRLPATWDDLEKLMKLFGIKGWIIGASADRASGEQINSDRTAAGCIGRGIIDEFTSYYFLLDLFMPLTNDAGGIESRLESWRERYYNVDKVVITEYQGLDLANWCTKNGFETEFVHTTYKYQKPRFQKMHQIFQKGLFKSPTVPYYTDERGALYEGYTNKADIFQEELKAFRHVSTGDRGKFGPPDKRKRGGVKDDVVDTACGGVYACDGEGMDEVARSAGEKQEFKAEIYGNPDLVGSY